MINQILYVYCSKHILTLLIMKKFTFILSLFLATSATFGTTYDMKFENDKEKKRKKKKKDAEEKNRNFHSVTKWKITVEYANGERISKTIVVPEDSAKSGLETAFEEATKYLKTSKEIQEYTVTPVTKNNFMLLAGDY